MFGKRAVEDREDRRYTDSRAVSKWDNRRAGSTDSEWAGPAIAATKAYRKGFGDTDARRPARSTFVGKPTTIPFR
jgi:hypothetical protein